MTYPNSTRTKVIELSGNGKLILTVEYYSGSMIVNSPYDSKAAETILTAAIEDAEEAEDGEGLTVIDELDELIEEAINTEDRPAHTATHFVHPHPYEMNGIEIVVRVTVSVPTVKLSAHDLIACARRILDYDVYDTVLQFLDPESYMVLTAEEEQVVDLRETIVFPAIPGQDYVLN